MPNGQIRCCNKEVQLQCFIHNNQNKILSKNVCKAEKKNIHNMIKSERQCSFLNLIFSSVVTIIIYIYSKFKTTTLAKVHTHTHHKKKEKNC